MLYPLRLLPVMLMLGCLLAAGNSMAGRNRGGEAWLICFATACAAVVGVPRIMPWGLGMRSMVVNGGSPEVAGSTGPACLEGGPVLLRVQAAAAAWILHHLLICLTSRRVAR